MAWKIWQISIKVNWEIYNIELKLLEKYHIDQAIKFGNYNIGRKYSVLTLPLYMAFLLDEY